MKLITATALAMTLAAGYSVAAAPKLHVTKTVTINAPADKVWNLVKDFNGTRIARYEKWDFTRLPDPAPADSDLFSAMAITLGKKTGWVDLGFGWNVRDSLRLDRAEVIEAFHELEPLYRVFHAVL